MIRTLTLATLSATLLLAGCGEGTPKPASAGATAAHNPPARSERARESIAKAITLLDQGKPKPARKILAGVLKGAPDDALAARLLKQIVEDPRALLGAESFAYKVQEGEGFGLLAQRFLGDSNLFYALARYNDMVAPNQLKPGAELRIPGQQKHETPVPPPPRPLPAPRAPEPPSPKRPAAKPTPPPAPVALPKPAPVAPSADPKRAAQLRAAALEQMNRGAIARAVALLGQASRLDPDNPLIRRDLDRAVRIQRTVQNGR